MKIKILLTGVVLFFVCSASFAQRPVYRTYADRNGRIVGSSTELPNGQILYRDRNGRPTGSSTRGSYKGQRIYADRSGSYQFRENQLKSGNSNFYDRSGKRVGSSTKRK